MTRSGPLLGGAAVLAALLFAGCAATNSDLSADDVAQLEEALECETPADCARLWRKAQAWLAMNSGYKIQASTEMIIQTYNAQPGSRTWAFMLTRIPLERDRERIVLEPSCGPGYVTFCTESPSKVVARFRRAMRSA